MSAVSAPSPKVKVQYNRPWMAEYQLRAIFHQERYGIVEATTKSGKTVGCMVWLAEQAMAGKDGHNFWWVAPIFSQAKIAFRRLKKGLPRDLYSSNETELTITLLNGAVIWFKGAENPDSLYGEDVYAAVIDEGSRTKEESWHAVRSTLTATRGPIRIIGNVKGRKNWFYHLARKFEGGDPGGHYEKITAWDAVKAGILEEDEIKDAQRQLPAHVFQELYLAEPSDDGSNPFGIDAIQACIAPLSSAPAERWGWDLAKSVDWTVGIGFDRDGRAAHVERFQRPWEETFDVIGRTTSGRAVVDSTGVGDPILERLQRYRPGTFTPYVFSAPSKQRLMEGLAVAIQQREITYPEGVITQELSMFEYVYTRTGVRYSAPEGLHDDCVMALGLAVECRKPGGEAPRFF
jgi:hypothetical protein